MQLSTPMSGIRASILTIAASATLLAAGCGKGDTFAKVNGQVITTGEYTKALERQMIQVPGGQQTNAEKMVLDQLIGNKVILAQAAAAGVLPSDAEVDQYFTVQKKLYEQNFPGKTYEQLMEEQGTTTTLIKSDIRTQIAETALYAKKLNLKDEEVKAAFDKAKSEGKLGLPARVQLRLIVAQAGSPDFAKAKQLLDQKTKFADVAKQVNLPQFKQTSGLIPQATPIAQLPPNWRSQVSHTADGTYFGPVDFGPAPQKGAPANQSPKAWVQVEKSLPAFALSYEDAKPLVRRQVVQEKMIDPANMPVRNEIMNQKMAAKFDASDKSYEQVWESVKKSAKDAGVGQQTTPPPPPAR